MNGDSVEKLAQDLDGNEKYILGILELLEDLGWMKRGFRGEYVLTEKGKTEPQDVHT